MIGHRSLSKSEQWYETFIYQQKGDTRNGPDKEGGDFRNLGHETQPSLFYALVGHQGLHCLPSWMIEGAANALGNESCFKEEADFIKDSQARLPSIESITHYTHAFNHVYNIYHKSLNNNKKLKRFIKESGIIKFTFSDTLFELSIDNIRRYDLNGNPQALTFADSEWFLSTLEIFIIDDNLRKKGFVYNKSKLPEILGVKDEYIYNREIKAISPAADDCFRFRMKKFVLS